MSIKVENATETKKFCRNIIVVLLLLKGSSVLCQKFGEKVAVPPASFPRKRESRRGAMNRALT